MRFRDRADAGRRLAAALARYKDCGAVICALPRGGVVLGAEIARALNASLTVVIARKIGHPQMPEYAICATSESGHLVCNEQERAAVDQRWFWQEVERQRSEAIRRRKAYLGDREPNGLQGKVGILVDDGIATGLTMQAAIQEIKGCHPSQVVVAVPVIPTDTARLLERLVDEVVALDTPEFFLGAVGAYYDDFQQLDDEDVIRLLRQSSP